MSMFAGIVMSLKPIAFSSTDLPQPFAPTKPYLVPWFILKSESIRSSIPWKDIPRASTITSLLFLCTDFLLSENVQIVFFINLLLAVSVNSFVMSISILGSI